MDIEFARELIGCRENERAHMLSGRNPGGMFLIDWREATSSIVAKVATAVGLDNLDVDFSKDPSMIAPEIQAERSTRPPKPGEQDRVLATLNRHLYPHHEIRLVGATAGGDSLGFVAATSIVWRTLEDDLGDAVAVAFPKLSLSSPLFSAPEWSKAELADMLRQGMLGKPPR